MMTENEVARQVVDAEYKIHVALRPGLLESAYEAVLAHELQKRGLKVVCQQPIPLLYDGVTLEVGYRADLIVEDAVIIELKSVEKCWLCDFARDSSFWGGAKQALAKTPMINCQFVSRRPAAPPAGGRSGPAV